VAIAALRRGRLVERPFADSRDTIVALATGPEDLAMIDDGN